jgi:hypothetical protein
VAFLFAFLAAGFGRHSFCLFGPVFGLLDDDVHLFLAQPTHRHERIGLDNR